MPLAKDASFRQLMTFRTVSRLGSVSLAAEELHLSQSAVSIQISTLEASTGAALLGRTGRGVRLTEAGEFLLGYADRLHALWNEASDEMATFLGEFSGTLRVGAVSTAEYWLPRLIVTFANGNPKLKLKLHVANRDEIVRSLAAREVDCVVMGQPPPELKLVALQIGKNPMAFVAAPHHPLMAVPGLTMERVAGERLLVREPGAGARKSIERVFREAGLRLRVHSELSSNEVLKQMCVAGFGPAFLSMHTCVLEIRAGVLALLPLPNNPIERDWYVVRLATRPVSQVVLAFETLLREQGQAEMSRQLAL